MRRVLQPETFSKCGRCRRNLSNVKSIARGFCPTCWRIVTKDDGKDFPESKESISYLEDEVIRSVILEELSSLETRLHKGE